MGSRHSSASSGGARARFASRAPRGPPDGRARALPGLPSHPDYADGPAALSGGLAGAMLSFDVADCDTPRPSGSLTPSGGRLGHNARRPLLDHGEAGADDAALARPGAAGRPRHRAGRVPDVGRDRGHRGPVEDLSRSRAPARRAERPDGRRASRRLRAGGVRRGRGQAELFAHPVVEGVRWRSLGHVDAAAIGTRASACRAGSARRPPSPGG